MHNNSAQPFIESALEFAQTPPLEYLAEFIESFVSDAGRRARISTKIFGAYHEWLHLLNERSVRDSLASLQHDTAADDSSFQSIRTASSEFASGLRELFFNRDKDSDPIADRSLNYVGF